jgi:maltooligosyltrehalose trehalohydrolase
MQHAREIPRLGAVVDRDRDMEGHGVRFRVWAPAARAIELVCDDHAHAMDAVGDGYFEALIADAAPGSRYGYRVDGGALWPDPASRFQPDGVHGRSEVVDPTAYAWGDAGWQGIAHRDLCFYELHVGTFSREGTFDGARQRLPYLRDLGVTAIELMPLADFPGRWNWGYDPAALWAPSRAYGRPDDLRRLVDEAHRLGLAVFLDVIYNHLGPDGAYVAGYQPMFTAAHHTPWGQAINLDGEHARGVRAFFLANALHWLDEYHFDGLRLDATFALVDDGPRHFLAELTERVHALPGPRHIVVAEDHTSRIDPVLRPRDAGGHGLDAMWADDFHHIVRRIVAGDSHGYYRGYPTTTAALAENVARGWTLPVTHAEPDDDRDDARDDARPRATQHQGTAPGNPPWVRQEQFVVCIQNHDQVGNRARGDRLHHAIALDVYRAASALLLFLPELPLLFMGQEWATTAPFQYFTDHNQELGRLVSEGRRRELAAFPDFVGEVPDPQSPETFARSKLDWAEIDRAPHRGILALYRDLLARRRELAGDASATSPVEGGLLVHRGQHLLAVALTGGVSLPVPAGATLVWHSEDPAYTEQPRPPRVAHGTIAFAAAAAAVFLDRRDGRVGRGGRV